MAKTVAQLQSEITTNLPSGNPAILTAASLRGVLNDIVTSMQPVVQVNAQTGASYTALASDLGQLVTLNNGSPVAVALPQATGSFAVFDTLFKNKGAGTVTLTPTTSTIDGQASASLPTGYAALIASDSTNYQAIFLPPVSSVGAMTLSPVSGAAFTINGAAGQFQGIAVNQSPSFTLAGTSFIANSITLTDTAHLDTTKAINGLTVNINCGAFGGARQAITGNVTTTGVLDAATAGAFLVGGAFGSFANASTGGTDTGANARGSFCGVNPAVGVLAGVTNIKGIKGGEVDISSGAGATMGNRVGWDIVLTQALTGGATIDRGLQFSMGDNSSLGWSQGIVFDSFGNTSGPVRSSGTLIASAGSWTVATCLDFSSATYTSLLKGAGFNIDGSGNLTFAGMNGAASGIWSWNGRSALQSSADGIVAVSNNAGSGFTRLILGTNDANGIALVKSTTTLKLRTGVDGADIAVTAASLSLSAGTVSSSPSTGTLVVTGGVGMTGTFSLAGGFQLYNPTPVALGFMGSVLAWQGSGSGTDCAFACNGANFKLYTNNTTSSTMTLSAAGTTFDKGTALVVGATGALGYGTGAGGAVTQATNRTTGVTLNSPTGAITMFTAAGSATPATFTVTNSSVAATDTVLLSIKSGATNSYNLSVSSIAAGSFVVTFFTTGGTASDTPIINYVVLKGATS